jgi:hypothetical protein
MEDKMVLAIDPGTVQSAYVFWNGVEVVDSGLVSNNSMLDILHSSLPKCKLAIEMITSYGMPVGADIFTTCIWIGRFIERWDGAARLVTRREVKMHLCETMRAKDANVRQALVDRFAYGYGNHGKGHKANPSIFYGFKQDMWQAMAVAVTAWDTRKQRTEAVAAAMKVAAVMKE